MGKDFFYICIIPNQWRTPLNGLIEIINKMGKGESRTLSRPINQWPRAKSLSISIAKKGFQLFTLTCIPA